MTGTIPVRSPLGKCDRHCVKSWLMRVVRNKSMDQLRMRPSSTIPLDDNTPDVLRNGPFQVTELLLQRDALSKVLASLPADQRRAWLIGGCSGLSLLGDRGQVGVPVSTVRGLLARSRHTLANEMAPWRLPPASSCENTHTKRLETEQRPRLANAGTGGQICRETGLREPPTPSRRPALLLG